MGILRRNQLGTNWLLQNSERLQNVLRITKRVAPGGAVDFALADRSGGGPTVEVAYSGSVPPTFRVGRELIVTGELKGRTFVAQPSSMVTKCPSKYSSAPSAT